MAIEGETRWGGEFGNGRLVTPEVWEIITVLTLLPEEQRAGVEHLYAMAVAWLNGCNQPRHNIETNTDGALANAYGDGRNNFLYGYMRTLAEIKAKEGKSALSIDIANGMETIPEDTPIEVDHVPASYYPGGNRYGLARAAPYEITSAIWKLVDAANDKQAAFLSSLEALEVGIGQSESLVQLAERMEGGRKTG